MAARDQNGRLPCGGTSRLLSWPANFTLNIYDALKYSDFNSNTISPVPGSGNQDYHLTVADGCWDFKCNNQFL